MLFFLCECQSPDVDRVFFCGQRKKSSCVRETLACARRFFECERHNFVRPSRSCGCDRLATACQTRTRLQVRDWRVRMRESWRCQSDNRQCQRGNCVCRFGKLVCQRLAWRCERRKRGSESGTRGCRRHNRVCKWRFSFRGCRHSLLAREPAGRKRRIRLPRGPRRYCCCC